MQVNDLYNLSTCSLALMKKPHMYITLLLHKEKSRGEATPYTCSYSLKYTSKNRTQPNTSLP